jgi:hypothetical protein
LLLYPIEETDQHIKISGNGFEIRGQAILIVNEKIKEDMVEAAPQTAGFGEGDEFFEGGV